MTDSREHEILWQIGVLNSKLDHLHRMVKMLLTGERNIMVTLQDIQANASAELDQIRAETDVMNAVKMVVDNQNAKLAALAQQIADLLAGGSATPEELQALADTVDAIRQTDTANAQIVADAVAAGTEVAPPPAKPQA